jgi:hypothetical protein
VRDCVAGNADIVGWVGLIPEELSDYPEGMTGRLSRRDRMLVARQFIAWVGASERDPSRRERSDSGTRDVFPALSVPRPQTYLKERVWRAMCTTVRLRHLCCNRITPFPTGRFKFSPIPGNELPGYDQSVPPGQGPRPRSWSATILAAEWFPGTCPKCDPRTTQLFSVPQISITHLHL